MFGALLGVGCLRRLVRATCRCGLGLDRYRLVWVCHLWVRIQRWVQVSVVVIVCGTGNENDDDGHCNYHHHLHRVPVADKRVYANFFNLQ